MKWAFVIQSLRDALIGWQSRASGEASVTMALDTTIRAQGITEESPKRNLGRRTKIVEIAGIVCKHAQDGGYDFSITNRSTQ